MFKDHYIVLGIGRNADQKEIKSAYRRIAKKYHPDTACPEASSKKFIELRKAYETLSDAKKRREYDRQLNGEKDVVRITVRHGPSGRQPAYAGGADRFVDAVDELFGGLAAGCGYRHRRFSTGDDIYLEAVLTQQEARQGGIYTVKAPVVTACPRCAGSFFDSPWCPLCSGYGQLQVEKRFSLRIPAGVQDGALIQFSLEAADGHSVQVHIVVRIEADWP